jgi:hypothetical protein
MYSTKLSPDGLYAGIILVARRPYFLSHRARNELGTDLSRVRRGTSGSGGRAAEETHNKNKTRALNEAATRGWWRVEESHGKKPDGVRKKIPKT